MSAPGLTVVLPVLNEAERLGGLLDGLRGQEPVPGGLEVLVVDGGSTDETPRLVRERTQSWPDLHLLHNPKKRSGPARNLGAARARGRYVLYLDGHCGLPRPDLLRRAVEVFESSGADCLCRPQPLEETAAGVWGEAIARARHSRFGHNPGSDIYSAEPGFTRPESAGAAYRIEVLHALGGYDERFDACEDVEFNHRLARAGYRAYKHPDLAVSYQPRGSLSALFRQMVRYGRGRARLMARHPDMTPWVLVAMTSAVLLWFLLLPLMEVGPWMRGWLVAISAYLIAAGAAALSAGGSASSAWRTAVVFPTIHGGLLAGFLRGLPETVYYKSPPGASDTLSVMQSNVPASG